MNAVVAELEKPTTGSREVGILVTTPGSPELISQVCNPAPAAGSKHLELRTKKNRTRSCWPGPVRLAMDTGQGTTRVTLLVL